MRKHQLKKEHKIANKIAELINDVTIDLDEIGKALATGQPTVSYNRFILIAETAVDEKERTYEQQYDRLFD